MEFDDIGYYLEKNFQRVDNLLSVYDSITPVGKKGRKPVRSLDQLRVTVVLLHSSLEDFIRTLLKNKLVSADGDQLSGIPLYLNDDEFSVKPKFDLRELKKHDGVSVTELVNKSIYQYLDRKSFNNSKEIVSVLTKISITMTPEIRGCLKLLDDMISRRHSIVHQADREKKAGKGFHDAKSISVKTVRQWIKNTDSFIAEIIKQS